MHECFLQLTLMLVLTQNTVQVTCSISHTWIEMFFTCCFFMCSNNYMFSVVTVTTTCMLSHIDTCINIIMSSGRYGGTKRTDTLIEQSVTILIEQSLHITPSIVEN